MFRHGVPTVPEAEMTGWPVLGVPQATLTESSKVPTVPEAEMTEPSRVRRVPTAEMTECSRVQSQHTKQKRKYRHFVFFIVVAGDPEKPSQLRIADFMSMALAMILS